MRQVELYAPKQLRVMDAPEPALGPHDLLIEVAQVGICGSDLHAYHDAHPFIDLPIVPGHEFAGTVVEMGASVTEFFIGDRVTVEPSLVCGTCYNCRHGRYNICEHLKVIGCQTPGAMAERISVPAAKAFRLPDGMTWDAATLAEPLAVAVHAVRIAEVPMGGNVLILGAGTIGLMVLQAFKALGSGKALVTDVLPERLALARKLGADGVVNPLETDLARATRDAFGPTRADVIFECVGVAATFHDALNVTRKGGTIVLAGVFSDDVPVNLGKVQDWELKLLGSLMYANGDFPTALELLHDAKVQVAPLITHHIPLEQAAAAFALADEREDALKVVLMISN